MKISSVKILKKLKEWAIYFFKYFLGYCWGRTMFDLLDTSNKNILYISAMIVVAIPFIGFEIRKKMIDREKGKIQKA